MSMNHPIRSRAGLVTWIESCVLGDVRTLLMGVDAYYALPTHAGQDGHLLGAANSLLVAGCCSGIGTGRLSLEQAAGLAVPTRL